jgi:hypothetical protein
LNLGWKILKIKIENSTLYALYHARFRTFTLESLASLNIFSYNELSGEWANPDNRFACLREARLPKPCAAGRRLGEGRARRRACDLKKTSKKEREKDAIRDGEKN